MKRTLIITTFLVAGAIGVLAQGKVSFNNDPWNFLDSPENGGAVDRMVYKAPGVLVDDASWTAVLYQGGAAIGDAIPFYGTDWPGVWNVYADPAGLEGGRSLTTAGGVATTLEVWVFNGSGTFVGKSDPFAYTAPSSPTPAPTDLLMANFRGFVVPEPSTIALGVLGLGALLLFRRRK